MTPPGPSAEAPPLSIGDLAERTGVAVATLRVWEQRHGFPAATRLPSGHRRYAESDVDLVRQVARRRDAGARLDAAIADTARAAAGAPPSIYARLRRLHPALPTHRLSKSTLVAMSWAIEDEFCAQAHAPLLYGAFQRERFYDLSRPRWDELAAGARSATVFADFDVTDTTAAPAEVALAAGAPLRREWAIVCVADGFPAVLTAWELPGQRGVPDAAREFEAAWSLEPADAVEAARVCEEVAAAAGTGGPPSGDPAPTDLPAPPDLHASTALFARVVAYTDRRSR
ncbi:DICT sensory domain-containing protein [Nocardioides sambongensis]|uniref:DICT sensory domain-containing protein n=1 Tax=Nocardioides sambongensis TaxID=2589074 RepID=UPI0015E83E07|nr:DICT sensory domain-containing protein [Nocardioides sambongensis]